MAKQIWSQPIRPETFYNYHLEMKVMEPALRWAGYTYPELNEPANSLNPTRENLRKIFVRIFYEEFDELTEQARKCAADEMASSLSAQALRSISEFVKTPEGQAYWQWTIQGQDYWRACYIAPLRQTTEPRMAQLMEEARKK